jgi:hypothetical protein
MALILDAPPVAALQPLQLTRIHNPLLKRKLWCDSCLTTARFQHLPMMCAAPAIEDIGISATIFFD